MASSRRAMPDEVIQCVIQYIHDPRNRAAVSRVCRRWHALDSEWRKHVTVAFCYSTTPDMLLRRFPYLESLKLKGRPRAYMFDLIREDWGGSVTPWVNRLSLFRNLNSLYFRRMIVTDSDLLTIANVRGDDLLSLQLDKCSGFSTHGLLHISTCRNLENLSLHWCLMDEISGEWLHQLAINCRDLRVLNFYLTKMDKINVQDIELIVRKCPLVCLKVVGSEPLNITNIFRTATSLEEFTWGGSANGQIDIDNRLVLPFPPHLLHLSLSEVRPTEMPLIFPLAHMLRTLDLGCAGLGEEDICTLVQRCLNLEVVVVTNIVGDRFLVTLSMSCKKLRRLRIDQELDEGTITGTGVIALSSGCTNLQYLAMYVSLITNEALDSIGSNLKNLHDFRLVVTKPIPDSPLDNGVKSLLLGCTHLKRFALYLEYGGLTDQGLGYLGQYSQNIKWMLLGNLGQSDEGLLALSQGCQTLQKLEIRGCPFLTERGLAQAAQNIRSLKYMWVEGHKAGNGEGLREMARPNWYVEIIHPSPEDAVQARAEQVFAYYSLTGRRTDYPEDGSVVPLLMP